MHEPDTRFYRPSAPARFDHPASVFQFRSPHPATYYPPPPPYPQFQPQQQQQVNPSTPIPTTHLQLPSPSAFYPPQAQPQDGPQGILMSTGERAPSTRNLKVCGAFPIVPGPLLDLALQGEYVDMRLFTAEGLECLSSCSTQADILRVAATIPDIAGIADWLEAFTVYIAVIAKSFPNLVPKLLGYQIFIGGAHRMSEAWYSYDKAFRRDNSLSTGDWDKLSGAQDWSWNQWIVTRLRGAPLSSASLCPCAAAPMPATALVSTSAPRNI
jgi:hypothetical protein